MKKLILLSFLFISSLKTYSSSYFEGIIEYSVTFNGEDAELMSAFMFSGYIFHFGKNGVKMEMQGGMSYMFGPFVTNYLDEKTYMLMEDERVAYEVEDEQDEVTSSTDDKKINGPKDVKAPLIEDMHSKEKILGYSTSKFKVTTYEDEEPLVLYYWMTEDILVKQVGQQMGVAVSLDGLTGFPLKIEGEFDGITMVQSVTSIKKEKLADGLFTVPADYEIKPFSESVIGAIGDE